MRKNHYWIFMADIQNSREQKGKQLMTDFQEVVRNSNQKLSSSILSPLTITLGDEFQGIVKDLAAGIKVILALEEEIIRRQKLFKLRYVMHYGAIETAINPDIAYGMLGPGLTQARGLLDSLKMRRGERIYLETQNSGKDDILNKLFFLYSALIDDWKQKEAETLALFFAHQDYKIVADKLHKDRSLLWRKEKSLRLREYTILKELLLEVSK